ncbi:MAG: hypothetical protein MJK14_18080 [Rivularia sp. ALOHA_DT_140]|nr:hypothetical protein [Rivularia sp. ALOHA_DT_140]
MSRKSRTERLNLSIEEKLKRHFSTVCTWKGVNMSDVAHELIEKWVEENAPPGLFDKEDKSIGNKQS